MRHLEPGPLKPTLDVKPLIRLATVKNALITTNLLGHGIQRLNDPQTQLLALLVLGHRDVLDMADKPHVVDELALDDDRSGSDDRVGLVTDY